jgi:anti-sigma regulatory factor (Ser/Thr protein kinase)
MTLWRADGMLWLAVSDCGMVFPNRRPRPPDPVAPVFPDLESDHGRGLYLVETLADVWTIVPRPATGKSVVAGLRIP